MNRGLCCTELMEAQPRVGAMWIFLCIFAQLCLLHSASGTADILLRVDVAIRPKTDHQRDHMTILRKVIDLPTIKVLFTGKDLNNQNILLVLKVNDMYWWSFVTSKLSEHGFRISVTPLQLCKEYAKEIGVDVDYISPSELRDIALINEWDMIIYDEGMTPDDYIDSLVKLFQRGEVIVTGEERKCVCYRSYGDLPVKLMFLTPHLPPAEVHKMNKIIGPEIRRFLDLRLLQNIVPTHDSEMF